jgi:hypothetical protein
MNETPRRRHEATILPSCFAGFPFYDSEIYRKGEEGAQRIPEAAILPSCTFFYFLWVKFRANGAMSQCVSCPMQNAKLEFYFSEITIFTISL